MKTDKVQCSFWKEACVILSRCLKQIDVDGNVEGSIQELDEDHSKSPHVILWEDQELQCFVLFASPELMLSVSLKGPEVFKATRDPWKLILNLWGALSLMSMFVEVRTQALQLVNGMARNSLSECCGREDSASSNGWKETREVGMLTSSKQVVEVLSKSGNVKDSVRVSTLLVSDGVNTTMVTVGPLILKDYLAVSQIAHAIASLQRDCGISINGLSVGRQALSLKVWVGCAAGSSDLSGKGLPPTTSTSKKRKATSLLCQHHAFKEAQNLLLHIANPEGIPNAKLARLSNPLTITPLLQPTDVKLRQSLCIAKNVEFVEDVSGSGNRPVNPFGLRTIVTKKDILLNNLNEASATICNEGHGFQPKVSFLDHFPPGASTYCLKVVHLLLLSSFRVTIPHKMSPLFGSFGLVPFFSVPPFGFCCCWPSIARSVKFLQTTQKQFRSAKTNYANRIT
ncbi:unnamed protein product [Sphagnum jensenii]|uniref:Uncharacterized protein n=1 Tax=Sphagnum jensenii TaxID=128206 RepID=A0ABP1BHQ7_9BRYO